MAEDIAQCCDQKLPGNRTSRCSSNPHIEELLQQSIGYLVYKVVAFPLLLWQDLRQTSLSFDVLGKGLPPAYLHEANGHRK